MILGTLLCVIGILLIIVGQFVGRVGLSIFLCFCFMSVGAILISSPLQGPDDKIPYSVTVEGQQFYFGDYDRHTEQKTTATSGMLVMDFNEVIVIPSHFYKKVGFVNSWEYCDLPMKIEIPHGCDVTVENHTSKPIPHIAEGGCK